MPHPVALDPAAFRTEVDGKPTDLHTLTGDGGVSVDVTDYGARIVRILAPDRDGVPGDVVLGYDNIRSVMGGQASMGAFIGRFANRIAHGRFTLDGVEHQLARNGGAHHIHGGVKGSRFRVFDTERLGPGAVRMSLTYADGEEGYPGELRSAVTYRLDGDTLRMEYEAVADRRTIVNFTGHAYFNLAGAGSILDHVLTMNARAFTPTDATAIPTGEIRPVAGTPFDFTTPHRIGERIDADDEQIRFGSGYDHNMVIDKPPGAFGPVATVEEPVSGRLLEVSSSEPGAQLHSGNFLTGAAPRDVGRGGVPFVRRGGLCIEPQRFPDAPNHPNFPSTVLDPGEIFRGVIAYRFGVR
ncbi:aldose 1-epimerase [Azospirillum agricola]|uniref:aldose epimerase family protein n=1 Tax=Azospirillum agricola TaxID=1720247 RepID=UPI001AE118B5|nr:aldose epimerase family protein [Azospirillum agricola]MBP2229590.1 aldose 1-epimerase [Azospirillum agricola]